MNAPQLKEDSKMKKVFLVMAAFALLTVVGSGIKEEVKKT
jgi:hypothetical protein